MKKLIIYLLLIVFQTKSLELDKKILEERFTKAGYEDLIIKTDIIGWLTQDKISDLWHIPVIVQYFFYKYCELQNVKKLSINSIIKIYEIISQDFPLEFKQLIKLCLKSETRQLFIHLPDTKVLIDRFKKAGLSFFIESSDLIKLFKKQPLINLKELLGIINQAIDDYLEHLLNPSQDELNTIRGTDPNFKKVVLKIILGEFGNAEIISEAIFEEHDKLPML